MNIYKWIASIAGFLVMLLLVVAMMMPSTYCVKRTITVKAPVADVFSKVADFKYWQLWNPWIPKDTTVKTNVSTPSFGRGSYWQWEGRRIGSGRLTTLDVIENKKISSRLEFMSPYSIVSEEIWTFEPMKDGTKVVWTDAGRLGFPFGRFFGPFLDNKMGPDFEKGLANIKVLCEKK